METDDPDENENSEVRTLSLLTLADLAIALQDQVDDHTYARNFDLPQVLDEQCLLIKEKDHNYSTCSRTELRGRAKYNMKKSSSEENLTTLYSSDSSDDFSFISKKSHSCEQVVTPPSSHSKLLSPEISDEVSANKLCSSWPKENAFKDYINEDLALKNINSGPVLTQLTVCDHTYARDKNSTICVKNNVDNLHDLNVIDQNLFHKDHNYDVRGKFSFNDPHKINLKRMKQTTKCGISNEQNKQNEVAREAYSKLLKTRPYFDHNYTYRTVHSHQTCGSVESLDMDLSESETDSCEETEQEETKLYKQMMNAQKDHPYSKSGILSF